jgi:hypothetical protein
VNEPKPADEMLDACIPNAPLPIALPLLIGGAGQVAPAKVQSFSDGKSTQSGRKIRDAENRIAAAWTDRWPSSTVMKTSVVPCPAMLPVTLALAISRHEQLPLRH